MTARGHRCPLPQVTHGRAALLSDRAARLFFSPTFAVAGTDSWCLEFNGTAFPRGNVEGGFRPSERHIARPGPLPCLRASGPRSGECLAIGAAPSCPAANIATKRGQNR